MQEELSKLGIINPKSVKLFYPETRDNKNIKVLRCEKSGVIFLDKVSQTLYDTHYKKQPGTSYWKTATRKEGLALTKQDDERRASYLKDILKNKDYADIGCGLGGVLDLIKPVAKSVSGVEPQNEIRSMLQKLGYNVHENIDNLPQKSADIITLFHSFEHLVKPLLSLEKIWGKLRPGGTIIIEVPHAKDALITEFECEAFKKFTFWSEHLILHTRNSLYTYLKKAKFKNIKIEGVQRYPLANHLWWLSRGEPGGQEKLKHFRETNLEKNYEKLLDRIDCTDTLLAYAKKS